MSAEQPNENYGRKEPIAGTPTRIETEFKDVSRSVFSLKDFVSTFPKHQQDWYIRYQKVLRLHQQGNKSKMAVARELNEKYDNVDNWMSGRSFPLIEKMVRKLRDWELYPLNSDNPHLPFIALLAGWNIGDGHLPRRLREIQFFEGDPKSLENLKTHIQTHFPKISFSEIEQASPNGYQLLVFDATLAHLFATLGVPTGNKSKTVFSVPRFVLDGSKDVKRYFLIGLLGSEINTPSLTRPHTVSHVIFGMSKSKLFEREHIQFLEQVRSLLKDLGISTSPISKYEEQPPANPRYCFSIHSNARNFIALCKNVPFEFFHSKYLAFEGLLDVMKYHEKRTELYYKALTLKVKNKRVSEISKDLGLPYSTVRNWIKGWRKPKIA